MGSELIINATLPETRIALLENGEIQELYIERDHNRGIVGNIYKGRVIRVLPGMQAAFVDIGLEKAAFLYVDDIFFPDMEAPIEMPTYPEGQQGQQSQERASTKSGPAPLPVPLASPIAVAVAPEEETDETNVDEMPMAISETGDEVWAKVEGEVEVVAEVPAEGPFVIEPVEEPVERVRKGPKGKASRDSKASKEAKEAKESAEDDDDSDDQPPTHRRKTGEVINIQDIVKEGQEILVQVAKDPIGTKGARLTCHISLPGRYLVFMPTVDHVGVSRRIESDVERRRLKENIMKYRPPGTGFIVRTASSTQDANKIKADIDYLVKTWNEVRDKFRKSKPPALVYQDYTLVIRAIRDMMTEEVDRLVVDSKSEHRQIMKFVQRFMPNVKSKIELYDKHSPIFDYYGIELELARALDRKVWLKSGGYLVIDQSEALVAIDVNTGRFVGKRNLEDTILKTNLEAVKEIAYQLRLRNCGGIIILDLIDMEKEANREKVYQALEEALKKDRARPTILKISQLGLVEMTRKRTRDNIVRTLCEPCPYCEGRGFIKNKLTLAYEILREIEREGLNRDTNCIIVECNPSVANVLGGDQGAILDDLQRTFGKEIVIKSNIAFHLEQYDVVAQRSDRKITVRDSKKDARGLGTVTSISDTLEDSQSGRRDEYSIGGIEESMKSLPFVDENQVSTDSDRELREERGGDRLRRGRRGSTSNTSRPVARKGKDRDKDRDREKEPIRRGAPVITPVGASDDEEFKVLHGKNDALDNDLDDDSLENDDLDSGSIDEGDDELEQGEESQEAVASGPRNYEEYIRTAPDAGTELTRAEWESQNYQRGFRPRQKPMSADGGDKDNRRRHRHRRSRRGRSRNAPRSQNRPHA